MIRRVLILSRRIDAPVMLKLLTAGVVISVAACAAMVFWRISGIDDGRDRITVAPPPAPASAVTDLPSILAWSPFGGTATTTQAAGGGLILKAIFMAFPAEASSAVIAVGEAPPVSVRPGQALPTGAVVQSIQIDHVILQSGTQTERLDFPAPPALIDAAVAPTAGLTIIAPASPAPQVAAVGATGALQGSGLSPTDQGLRVGDAMPPALRAAGLQPGDVITRVNNQAVVGNADPRAILDQAVASGGARIDVIRNGRTLTLSFPLR